MVYNIHQRELAGPASQVGALIDSLASSTDRLWPHQQWPTMRFDRALAVGATGGHGPIRYFVAAYEPGRRIEFQFTGPAGFNGHHGYEIFELNEHRTLLRHELCMQTTGLARITWPLIFRPLHNALIEESLDRAEKAGHNSAAAAHRRTWWTKTLRSAFSWAMSRT